MSTLALAVLASGGGRSLANLLEKSAAGRLDAKVVHVLVSRAGVGAAARAAARGIPVTVCGPEALTAHLDALRPDLVVMAGYLKRWPIPDRWVGKAINIHPSLLPDFGGPGLWGDRVHAAVLASGRKESGCTVHFVTAEYDAGPIILQRRCPVLQGDTVESLAARVFSEEVIALPEAICGIASGRVEMVTGGRPAPPRG